MQAISSEKAVEVLNDVRRKVVQEIVAPLLDENEALKMENQRLKQRLRRFMAPSGQSSSE